MSGHYETRYAGCGHLYSQCRCPGPKEVTHIAGQCAKCSTPRPEGYMDLTGQCILTGVTYPKGTGGIDIIAHGR